MPIITRAAFAKIAKVNKVQVTKLIKSGTLTGRKVDLYIDTSAPKNRAYLKKHGVVLKKKAKKEEQPLQIQKVMEEVRLKGEQADLIAQKRAQAMGLLIERDIVSQMMAAFGVELKIRFLDLPRRVSPRIHAIVKAKGGPRAVEEILDKEIADGLKHAKEKARALGLGDIAR
jgi:phage terminase Nu1 subunit (DNA packaging protein)